MFVKVDKPYLAISKKLLSEYISSSGGASSFTAINNIIKKLTDEGRFNRFTKVEIEDFKKEHQRIFDNLNYLKKDKEHIPVVLLSDRKYALTYDKKFAEALLNFPGYKDKVKVEKRPENLPYFE